MFRLALLFALAGIIAIGCGPVPQPGDRNRTASTEALPKGSVGPDCPPFWVRSGYRVTLAADDVGLARFMAVDDKNPDLLYLVRCWYPGMTQYKDIVTLRLENGKYKIINTFVDNREELNGIQVKDGWVWFAQKGSIHKARDTNGDGKADEIIDVVPEGVMKIAPKKPVPLGEEHYWRALLVTDDKIYTSIGDSSNMTDEVDTERQKIWTFDLEGKNKTLFCGGLRNTEELQFRPETQELYGCDNSVDMYGELYGEEIAPVHYPRIAPQPITDNNPPDELNLYVKDGFYGHPFVSGSIIPYKPYEKRPDIIEWADKTIAPAFPFPAHSAPIGFTFISRKDHFPADHYADLFVCLKGSNMAWRKRAHTVSRVMFDKELGKPYGLQTIVDLLDQNGEALARPVDIVEAPDGSLLFTTEKKDRIYRLEWVGPKG